MLMFLQHIDHPAGSGQEQATQPIFVTIVYDQSDDDDTPEVLSIVKTEQKPLPEDQPEQEEETNEIEPLQILSGTIPLPEPKKKKERKASAPVPQRAATTPAKGQTQPPQHYSGQSAAADILYREQVRAEINRHRLYPRLGRKRKLEGEAVIRLEVLRSGTIASQSFVKSSGHHILDQAAWEMVKASDPLPEVPASIKAVPLRIDVPLAFRLKGE